MEFKIKKKNKLIKIAMIAILVSAVFAFYSFSVEPHMLQEKTTVIQSSEIPQSFVDKKIVFASDFHLDKFSSRENIARVVGRINDQKPDLVILGGDYVTGEEEYITPCFEELSKLRAPMGVYGVTGNHDSWTDYNAVVRAMKKAGIIPMENDSEWLQIGDDRIKLGGVATSFERKSDIAPTIKDVTKDDFVMLVSHNPDLAEEIQTDRIDVMLAGHNHAGQVTFFGLWAPYVPSDYGQKYLKGIVNTPHTKVIISNGVGNSFLPLRFCAPPQIDVLILKNK